METLHDTKTANDVKKILYPLCGDNLKLKRLIGRTLKANANVDFEVFNSPTVKWDIEVDSYDSELGEGSLFATNDSDGWELTELTQDFSKVFDYTFDFDRVKLANGKLLFAYYDDIFNAVVFNILEPENMVDGVIDFYGIEGVDVNTMFPVYNCEEDIINHISNKIDLSQHDDIPCLSKSMTKDELIERLSLFPHLVKEGFDLSIVLSYHNMIKEHKVFENYIDVYELTEPYCDEEDEPVDLSMFDTAHIRLFVPMVIEGKSYLPIGIIDPLGLHNLDDMDSFKNYLTETFYESLGFDRVIFFDENSLT